MGASQKRFPEIVDFPGLTYSEHPGEKLDHSWQHPKDQRWFPDPETALRRTVHRRASRRNGILGLHLVVLVEATRITTIV